MKRAIRIAMLLMLPAAAACEPYYWDVGYSADTPYYGTGPYYGSYYGGAYARPYYGGVYARPYYYRPVYRGYYPGRGYYYGRGYGRPGGAYVAPPRAAPYHR